MNIASLYTNRLLIKEDQIHQSKCVSRHRFYIDRMSYPCIDLGCDHMPMIGANKELNLIGTKSRLVEAKARRVGLQNRSIDYVRSSDE